MKISPLTLPFVDSFAEMVAGLYAEDPGDDPMTVDRARAQARRMLETPDRVFPQLIYSDGALAGYAILVPYFSNEYGGVALWLDEFYIRPEHRGRGIGGEFLDDLKKWACEQNMVRLVLEVRPANHRARKLYETQGFKPGKNIMMGLDLKD